MQQSNLARLRRIRARARFAVDHAEVMLATHREKLDRLEAAIRDLAPELDLPIPPRRPNPVFARGEMRSFALTVMREAAEPLPIGVIVVRMLAMKGIDLPSRSLRRDMQARVAYALCMIRDRGVVELVGKRGSWRWKIRHIDK